MFCTLVIPVHDESECIGGLLAEIGEVMVSYDDRWEVICIDDGSGDGTTGVLRQYEHSLPLTIIRLPRRVGQSAALWIGLSRVQEGLVAILDGDGQNPPHEIPQLLARFERGDCDAVIGHRRPRCDSMQKRMFSLVANCLRKMVTGSRLPDSGCGLKVFRQDMIVDLIPMQSLHRFLPTMFEAAGYSVVSIPVTHRPRPAGRSKYGILNRTLAPLGDLLALVWLYRRRLPRDIVVGASGNCADQLPATEIATR